MHASSSSRPYAATHTAAMTTAFDPAYSSHLALPESLPLFQFSFEVVSAPSLLEPSPLVHLIQISAIGSIPAPYHSTCPVRDVGEHIVAVVASLRICARCSLPHGQRSRPVSATVSNATSSSQPFAPSIDKASDALLAVAYEIPRCSDSALALEPSLRSAPAVGVRVDVLLFADVCVWEARGCDEGSPALPPCPRQSGALSSDAGN
ncbi:hypothetical protein DFH08DRAFT_957448 [Mycena albidolilacea]|uniref:Uncharacterized protein n=1 Tax=Mycena albidolilacea TaxID=1033008 RepID=A0AAD7EV27_9AGAR|nr:hypothetical protein DFH08DRAFT_957448 [Mycena albidolilacea]